MMTVVAILLWVIIIRMITRSSSRYKKPQIQDRNPSF